jgi:methionine synthase II (cobalamin-independent)
MKGYRKHPETLRVDQSNCGNRRLADPKLDSLYEDAIRDTIQELEATGSPIISDGEQRKYHNFSTYSVHGLPNTAPDGFKIPFSAGHVRRKGQPSGQHLLGFVKGS